MSIYLILHRRDIWTKIFFVTISNFSYESGVLEDPGVVPPNGIYKMTRDLQSSEDYASTIDIVFKKGNTTYLDIRLIYFLRFKMILYTYYY